MFRSCIFITLSMSYTSPSLVFARILPVAPFPLLCSKSAPLGALFGPSRSSAHRPRLSASSGRLLHPFLRHPLVSGTPAEHCFRARRTEHRKGHATAAALLSARAIAQAARPSAAASLCGPSTRFGAVLRLASAMVAMRTVQLLGTA